MLALVILAALLLLGLPFLVSQTSSLAGARSFAHRELARAGVEAAETAGVAAGVTSIAPHMKGGGTEAFSTIPQTLNDVLGAGTVVRLGNNRFALDLDAGGLSALGLQTSPRPFDMPILGVVIEDESAKFDPNSLSEAGWDGLLKAVGIPDWDDSTVDDSEDSTNHRHGANNQNPDDDDPDDYGELARMLSELPLFLPGGKITRMEQLLLAARSGYVAHGSHNTAGGGRGFREPLSRAELIRLMPYLTLWNPAPGRDGEIDLGTIVHDEPWPNGEHDYYLDGVVHGVLGLGTRLINQSQAARGTTTRDMSTVYLVDRNNAQRFRGRGTRGYMIGSRGDPLSILGPAAVNYHHFDEAVAKALQVGTLGNRQISTYAELRDTPTGVEAFNRQSPLSVSVALTNGGAPDILVELPPLDIRSAGVVTVETAATMTDRSDRQTAQTARRRVIQAVRQERVSERRWLTQGQHHNNQAQRYGSMVDTWPNPVTRLQQDLAETRSWPEDANGAAGLTAATQENLATGFRQEFARGRSGGKVSQPSHLLVEFQLPFGGSLPITAADLLTDAVAQAKPVVGGPDVSLLDPDGYRLSQPLAYAATAILGQGAGTARVDFAGRHLAMWVRPDADWGPGGQICLFESRSPAANQPTQWDGIPAITDSFNNLGLYFDRDKQLLMLAWAPPSVPWTSDTSARIPADDETTVNIDERSHGTSGSLLAPLAPKQGDVAKLSAVSPLLAPNRIVACYKVPDREGKPHFRKGQWYHIQVALSAPRPGEVAIMVDGIVGREASKMPSPALEKLGDHCLLPALPLSGTLDTADLSRDRALLARTDITVKPISGIDLTAQDLFPARGVLRIDDEYISYDKVSGNTFTGCVRGVRQDSHAVYQSGPPNPARDPLLRQPQIQEHLDGALVCPSGFRLRPAQAGEIYHGGCTLAHRYGSGDPQPPVAGLPDDQWKIWAAVDPEKPPVTKHPTDPNLRVLDLAGKRQIPLASPGSSTSGVADQFPNEGIAELRSEGGGRICTFYYEKQGNLLAKLVAVDAWRQEPVYSGWTYWTTDADFPSDLTFRFDHPPRVYLLSIQATSGVDMFETGRYKQQHKDNNMDDAWDDRFLITINGSQSLVDRWKFPIQLRDLSTGRIEWLAYHQLMEGSGKQFLVNHRGSRREQRGLERTDFAGKTGSLLSQTTEFPIGSLIEPVQTELGNSRHWLVTGDVLTFIPRAACSGAVGTIANRAPGKPTQAIVRYSAVDGWHLTDLTLPMQSDVKNGWFTLLPPELGDALSIADLNQYDILNGPGWSGHDLSPYSAARQPRGYWPRHDLLGQNARVHLMGGDTANGGTTPQTTAAIDGVCSGPLWGADGTLSPSGTPLGIYGTAGGDIALDQTVVVDAGIFNRNRPGRGVSSNSSCLALVDGEVVALRTSAPVDVIARGLLDFESVDPKHTFAKGPPNPSSGSPDDLAPRHPVCILPLGPVRSLVGAFGATQPMQFTDQLGKLKRGNPSVVELDAPCALFLPRDGNPGQGEAVRLIGPAAMMRPPYPGRVYFTTEWLRGLYATPKGSWGTDALVLGWWPRFAPSLPEAAQCTQEHFRCRSYVWAGFPLHLHNASFDPSLLQGIDIASVDVNEPIDPLFQLQARALAGGVDWMVSPSAQLITGSNGSALTACFQTNQFLNTVTGGAELRVTWHYARPPSADLAAMADAMNRTPPKIGAVRLRCLAPVKVLHTEGAK
ncbi:hypothetical protein LBMAG53_11860 [Planctomycetota bacterium]|nr:hypothetical protein LBMAG53_11860 [Planctomycetota bacterium]